MDNFKDRNYYPVAWNKMCVTSTTTSTPNIDGTNVLGSKYAITYKSDDGTDIGDVGDIYIGTGVTFTPGTIPTRIVNISAGTVLEQTFYMNTQPVFKWDYIYNSDSQLIGFRVLNIDGTPFTALEL